MFRKLTLLYFLVIGWNALAAQVVFTDPIFPKVDDAVTIFFDATQGDRGLANCNCDIYLHSGVITNESSSSSDWKHVFTQWGVANAAWKLTPVPGESNLYSYEITPSIKSFYGVGENEIVEKLSFVFRDATGGRTGRDIGGADIFYDVFPANFPFSDLLLSPASSSFLASLGESISIDYAVSEEATITLFEDGNQITQTTGKSLKFDLPVDETGAHTVEIKADNGSNQLSETFTYIVLTETTPENPPAGTEPGISFINDQSVRLALFAPGKQSVFVLGDFNDWQIDPGFQMKKSVDGNTFWLEVNGLTPGENYAFQYLVDGAIRIADPYSTVILDPFNDGFIPEVTYPNLPTYPEKATGIVSLIQPGALAYQWQVDDFERPAKEELVIYELLLRDFIERHDYTTLIDTLDYLDRLGVNAIELMPVNEFEGNISWGYNPSFHMALDKYYGPIDEFKRFVDACHTRGIAVILDVVYNHAFGQSPLAQMYFENGRPSADNPWLNVNPTHPFNVGNDFNHESQATVDFVDRVIRFWPVRIPGRWIPF